MMTYQQESMLAIWDELLPLFERHYIEIAKYQDIALDPDRDAYATAEANGQLRCYTARDRGELVGYVIFFVRTNLHYKGSLQAMQDVLFIDPTRRKGAMAGVRLIKFAEQWLQTEGVQVVYHHAKRINRLGELLQRLGYELSDELYAKRLD